MYAERQSLGCWVTILHKVSAETVMQSSHLTGQLDTGYCHVDLDPIQYTWLGGHEPHARHMLPGAGDQARH